jgi:hypothetical protein
VRSHRMGAAPNVGAHRLRESSRRRSADVPPKVACAATYARGMTLDALRLRALWHGELCKIGGGKKEKKEKRRKKEKKENIFVLPKIGSVPGLKKAGVSAPSKFFTVPMEALSDAKNRMCDAQQDELDRIAPHVPFPRGAKLTSAEPTARFALVLGESPVAVLSIHATEAGARMSMQFDENDARYQRVLGYTPEPEDLAVMFAATFREDDRVVAALLGILSRDTDARVAVLLEAALPYAHVDLIRHAEAAACEVDTRVDVAGGVMDALLASGLGEAETIAAVDAYCRCIAARSAPFPRAFTRVYRENSTVLLSMVTEVTVV